MMLRTAGMFLCLCGAMAAGLAQEARPPITLDEFLNTTEIRSAKISPDGQAVVVWTSSPDWQHNRFRDDLWLWQQNTNALTPLTQAGFDSQPAWSPDGKYIAFLSLRPLTDDEPDDKNNKEDTERVWVISASGGEAFPLYTEKLEAHAFAWSADGAKVLFSTRQPLTKAEEDAQKQEWKDVVRWREQERGDLLLAVPFQAAMAENQKTPAPHDKKQDDEHPLPKIAQVLAKNDRAITEIASSANQIAFETGSVSKRMEGRKPMKFIWSAQIAEVRGSSRITRRWRAGCTGVPMENGFTLMCARQQGRSKANIRMCRVACMPWTHRAEKWTGWARTSADRLRITRSRTTAASLPRDLRAHSSSSTK